MPSDQTARCWRCDRAVPRGHGERFVFGVVCDRAECRRTRQAFSKAHKMFWFRASLPSGDGLGRASSYNTDGEVTRHV